MSVLLNKPWLPLIAKGMLFLYLAVMVVVIAVSLYRRTARLPLDMAAVQQMRYEQAVQKR